MKHQKSVNKLNSQTDEDEFAGVSTFVAVYLLLLLVLGVYALIR